MVRASICICTLDRADDLEKALASLTCSPGIHECEILVINNSDTHASKNVVDRFVGKLNIGYFVVPERSLGKARNAGWRHARTPVVAYLDDDAVVAPSWVSALLQFADSPDLSGQTGKVLADPSLDYLSQTFHRSVCTSAFSLLDYGNSARDLSYGESPIGNNMAFKRALLEESGGFADNLRTYDEAFLAWPAMWKGMRFRYVPSMQITHSVSQNRQSLVWIRNKTSLSGVTYQILLSRLRSFPECPGNWSILFRGGRAAAGWLVSSLLRRKKQAFAFECEVRFHWNRLLFLLGMRNPGDYD